MDRDQPHAMGLRNQSATVRRIRVAEGLRAGRNDRQNRSALLRGPFAWGGGKLGNQCRQTRSIFALGPSICAKSFLRGMIGRRALRGAAMSHSCAALLALVIATASGGLGLAADILPCAQFTHEGPPEPVPRDDQRGLERLERINDAVKNTSYSIVFFGDSLTEGWDPVAWEKRLAPRGVLNAGIAGDFTDHVLWRLKHGNLAGPPPRAVILLIGTNDLAAHRSPELTADGIRANLILLRQHLPEARILLLGLLPREEFADAPLRRAAAQVNKLISDCADGEHIVYAEIGDVLLDSDGWLGTALSPDWLHFNESGYALLASRLEPVLDRVLAGGR